MSKEPATEDFVDRAIEAQEKIFDAKLSGIKDVLKAELEGRDKAVALLVSSQGHRTATLIAVVAVLELALRMWGK
jgi:hypothetical protein